MDKEASMRPLERVRDLAEDNDAFRQPFPQPLHQAFLDIHQENTSYTSSFSLLLDQQNSSIPVGGRMSHFLPFWNQNIRHKWSNQVGSQGYAMEFLTPPSLSFQVKVTYFPTDQHPVL